MPRTTPAKEEAWVVGRSRQALAAIKALHPPPSLARLHERVVEVEAREINFAGSLVARVEAGKLSPIAAAHDFEHLPGVATEDTLWRKMGAKICAESPAQYLSQHPR
jgi:hypothetical protein